MTDEFRLNFIVNDNGSVVIENVGRLLRRVGEEGTRMGRDVKRGAEFSEEAFEGLAKSVDDTRKKLLAQRDATLRAASAATSAADAGMLFRKAFKLGGLILDANKAERKLTDIARVSRSTERFKFLDEVAISEIERASQAVELLTAKMQAQERIAQGNAGELRKVYGAAADELEGLDFQIKDTIRLLQLSRDASTDLSSTEVKNINKRIDKLKELNSLVSGRGEEVAAAKEVAAVQDKAIRREQERIGLSNRMRDRLKEEITEIRTLASVGKIAGQTIVLGQKDGAAAIQNVVKWTGEERLAVEKAIDSHRRLAVQRKNAAAALQDAPTTGTSAGVGPAVSPDIGKGIAARVAEEGQAGADAVRKLRQEFAGFFKFESEIGRSTQRIQDQIDNQSRALKERAADIRATIFSQKQLTDSTEILANGGAIAFERLAGVSDQVFAVSQQAIVEIGKELGQLDDLRQELTATSQAAERYTQAQDRASQVDAFSKGSVEQLESLDSIFKVLIFDINALADQAEKSGEVEFNEFTKIHGAVEDLIDVNRERAAFAKQVATETAGITDEEAKSVLELASRFDEAAKEGEKLASALSGVVDLADETTRTMTKEARLKDLFSGSDTAFEKLNSQFTLITTQTKSLRDQLKSGADVDEGFIAKLTQRTSAFPTAAAQTLGAITKLRTEAASLGGDTTKFDKLIAKITNLANKSIAAQTEVEELGNDIRVASAERIVKEGTAAAVDSMKQSLMGAKAAVSAFKTEFKDTGVVTDASLNKAAGAVLQVKQRIRVAKEEVVRLGQSFAGTSPQINESLKSAIANLDKMRQEEILVNQEFQKVNAAVQAVRALQPELDKVAATQAKLAAQTAESTGKVDKFGKTWKTVGVIGQVAAVKLEKENRKLNETIKQEIVSLRKLADQAKGTNLEGQFKQAIKSMQALEKETGDSTDKMAKLDTTAQRLLKTYEEYSDVDRIMAKISESTQRFAVNVASALTPMNILRKSAQGVGAIIQRAFGGGGGGPLGPFRAGISAAARGVTALGSRIKKTITSSRQGFAGFGSQLFSLRGIIASLFVGFGIRQVLNDFATFRSQINGVQAAAGATTKEIRELENANFQLAQTTRFTSQDVAGAQRFFAQQGLSIAEITQIQGDAARFAEATNLKFAKAADIALKTTNQFRLGLEELPHVQDVLVATTNNSAATVEGLAQALKNVGPVAAGFGISLEESNAALAILAKNGIRAGRAGTVLRTGLARLQKPGKEAREALEKLGRRVGKDFRKELFDADGTLISLAKSFQFLEEAAASPRDLVAIFGQEAQRAGSALIGNSRNITEFAENLEKLNDTTKKASDIQRQGFAQAQFELTSSFDVLFKTITRSLEPALVSLYGTVTAGIRRFRLFYLEIVKSGAVSTALTTIRDVALDTINFLVNDFGPDAIRVVTKIGKSIGTSFADGMSIVFDMAARLAGAFGFTSVEEGFDGIAQSLSDISSQIENGTIPSVEDLVAAFDKGKGVTETLQKMKIGLRLIGGLFISAKFLALTAIDGIIRGVASIGFKVVDSLNNLRNNIINILTGIALVSSSIFTTMTGAIKALFSEIGPALRTSIADSIADAVKDLPKPTSVLGKALYGLIPGFNAISTGRDQLLGFADSLRPATTRLERLQAAAKATGEDVKAAARDVIKLGDSFKKTDPQADQLARSLSLIANEGLPDLNRSIDAAAAAEDAYVASTEAAIVKSKEAIVVAGELAEARAAVSTGPVQTVESDPAGQFQVGDADVVRGVPDPAPGFRESIFGAVEAGGDAQTQKLLEIAEQGKTFREQQLVDQDSYEQQRLDLIAAAAERESAIREAQRAGDLASSQAAEKKFRKADQKAQDSRAKLEAIRKKVTINSTKQLFGALLRLSGEGNEKIFKAMKAFAIADATIQAFRAANRALAELPPPSNVIAAAAALANGLANVKAIKSQQPGGGSGGGMGGGSGTLVPSPPPVPAAPVIPEVTDEDGEALRGQRNLSVIIEGNVFGDEEFVRDRIAPVIRESLDDNEDFGLDVDVTRA